HDLTLVGRERWIRAWAALDGRGARARRVRALPGSHGGVVRPPSCLEMAGWLAMGPGRVASAGLALAAARKAMRVVDVAAAARVEAAALGAAHGVRGASAGFGMSTEAPAVDICMGDRPADRRGD